MCTAQWVKAETLTPFCYHSLPIPSGTATLPMLIGDRALSFALAATLGMLRPTVALPTKKNYQRDMAVMPWRCSVLLAEQPRLLPPLVRRRNLDAEAGFPRKLQDVAKKGNLKDYFLTQELPPGQVFRGAIFGADPFQMAGRDRLVLRIGLHRNGMIRLERDESPKDFVHLNAATAALFGRCLKVERFLLANLQLTEPMTLADAAREVAEWQ